MTPVISQTQRILGDSGSKLAVCPAGSGDGGGSDGDMRTISSPAASRIRADHRQRLGAGTRTQQPTVHSAEPATATVWVLSPG